MRHHIGIDASARINRFGHRVIVITRQDDRIARGIDAGYNADMPTTVTAHDRDSPDLGSRHARAVMRIVAGEIAAAGMPGALKHQIHEGAAPEAAAPGRIGANIFARLRHQRIRAEAAKGVIGVSNAGMPGAFARHGFRRLDAGQGIGLAVRTARSLRADCRPHRMMPDPMGGFRIRREAQRCKSDRTEQNDCLMFSSKSHEA